MFMLSPLDLGIDLICNQFPLSLSIHFPFNKLIFGNIYFLIRFRWQSNLAILASRAYSRGSVNRIANKRKLRLMMTNNSSNDSPIMYSNLDYYLSYLSEFEFLSIILHFYCQLERSLYWVLICKFSTLIACLQSTSSHISFTYSFYFLHAILWAQLIECSKQNIQ